MLARPDQDLGPDLDFQPGDIISKFMQLSEEWPPSPRIFRLWSAISLIAGCLERRVWTNSGRGEIFPNLYTLLVAPPGVGKFVIEGVRRLWTDTKEPGSKLDAFKVAPDSMTKASLMDNLVQSLQSKILPQGIYNYHCLNVAAEELSVLLPAYDMEYIGTLNSIWNNKQEHKETRRTGSVREINLHCPMINLLAGVQPAFMASLFPEDAWNTGLARRLVLVYSSSGPKHDFFYEEEPNTRLRQELLRDLGKLSQLYGEIRWSEPARIKFKSWYVGGQKPAPTHSKLTHYLNSRGFFAAKLCLISTIASKGKICPIEPEDVDRALTWMFEIESHMPDIFRDMIGKSDAAVLDELYNFAFKEYNRLGKRNPLPGRMLWEFLAARLPSEKVSGVFSLAERTGIVARVAGTEDDWIPRPKEFHAPE